MWPLVSGAVAHSPRTEIPLSIASPRSYSAALIVGDFKLLLGTMGLSYWQGPSFPNKSDPGPIWGVNKPYGTGDSMSQPCGSVQNLSGGCLYNIRSDPHETTDLAATMPAKLQELKSRYQELAKTRLDQDYVAYFFDACGACGGYMPCPNTTTAGSDYRHMGSGLAPPPPPPVPRGVLALCRRWSDAFITMLQRNDGHLGPYL